MPAEEALGILVAAFAANPSTNVLLVSEPEGETVIQRLNLDDGLAADFRSVAQDACSYILGALRLRAYDPGYKPEPDELSYIDLANDADLATRIQELTRVQQAELFVEDDAVIDALRFYSIVISPSARRHAVFLRSYSPKKELSRKTGFAAILGRGHYNKVETKIFLFDWKVDCFAWGGYLFIPNVSSFQRIFKYFEGLRAKAQETLDTILAQIPVSNADDFRNACIGQIQMISKLAQIARKPYLPAVTIADLRRTINEFDLDVQIAEIDGEERLVFEGAPAKRWLILKLLDDNYLGSVMTTLKYEVNSKSPL
ncbi:Kiwa anti-phage protein KwaB-like domain-containing protein [Granulicella sibirica]|uniref:Kiwa anti-phage protein KwaB-like domain-containing protein n=1 Tax=Granulicella sibirica TaxID=2479048 RepID=UPI0010091B96|nr:Kiwa anti-phage protein KwaB-like domain-containing protein [Granulicella sibirica]